MSKNKPKETVEVVIRMQDKERKILEDLTTAYSIRNVGQGVGSILNPIATFLGNAEVTILLLPLLYALFYPRRKMEIHDPLLYHAITEGPIHFGTNFGIWYVTQRKQALESESPEVREAWDHLGQLAIDKMPIIGFIFRLFRDTRSPPPTPTPYSQPPPVVPGGYPGRPPP